MPLENLGVRPDQRHHMTRADLLNDNVDLLDRDGELLSAMPVQRLHVTLSAGGNDLTVNAKTPGLDRLDTWVQGRPDDTRNVGDGAASCNLTRPAGPPRLRLSGYKAGRAVAVRPLQH